MRGILFVLSLALAALGLLTVFRIPDWLDWKAALLAGEYGYGLALGALLVAWAARGHGGWAVATVALALGAAVLLIRPCVEAGRIGRELPAQLAQAFGPRPHSVHPFSLRALWQRNSAPVPATTLTYAPGRQLDYYRAVGRERAPVVIIVHGGGWNDGDRGQIPQFNHWLAHRGYAVADISYRLAPAAIWPAQREDVLAAIAFLKGQAGELGLDPGRLVVLGRSAGGQIAEAAVYAAADPAIRGVVGLYAPADMHFAYAFGREDDALKSPKLLRQFLGGTPAEAGPAYDSASGILLVKPASPPTLLVHGGLDTLVWNRQSERLSARLAEAKVPHFLLSLPWATHAVEYHLGGPSGQLTTYALEWFLGAVTK